MPLLETQCGQKTFKSWVKLCRKRPRIKKRIFVSKYILQFLIFVKCYKIITESIHIITPKLTPWSIISLQKLITTQLVKKFPITRPHPQADQSSWTLTPSFLKTPFNTIFTYMWRSLKGSNALTFPSGTFTHLYFSHVCYMLQPLHCCLIFLSFKGFYFIYLHHICSLNRFFNFVPVFSKNISNFSLPILRYLFVVDKTLILYCSSIILHPVTSNVRINPILTAVI